MTLLEAINDILQQCGEAPISTSEGTLPPEAEIVQRCISQAAVSLCCLPHSFNVVTKETLPADTNGHVYVPSDTLSVLLEDANASLRGNEIKTTGDDLPYGEPAKVIRRIISIPFEKLPSYAMSLVQWSAAISAYTPVTGSENVPDSIVRLLQQARLVFLRNERAATQPNALGNRGATRRPIGR